MFNWKEEPKTKYEYIVASLMISIGLILFLTTLHLLSINESGNTQSVLTTTFEVGLKVSISLFSMVFIFTLIYIIRWLAFIAIVPKWERQERRNNKNG